MSWGQAASTAGNVGQGSQYTSLYGQMADIGGKGSEAGGAVVSGAQPVQPTSGFSMQAEGTGTGQGPTVANDAALTRGTPNEYNTAAAQGVKDVGEYGTANPTFMDKASNMLERFQKGSDQGVLKTVVNKQFGNNPETYGAAYGLVNKMAGPGKPQSGAPITTNISYQQPENPYLRKRGRY